MNAFFEPVEGKTGSGALVASSESDGWNVNTPWNEYPHARSSGVSPSRRSSVQAQVPQQYGDGLPSTNYFAGQRASSVSQNHINKTVKSMLDPTSGTFSSLRQAEPQANGFRGFGRSEQADATYRSEVPQGTWNGTGSLNSPTGDRGSMVPEYFTPSAAPSRNGSLPPSRHGGELSQLNQQPDNTWAMVQPARAPSLSNDRAYQERNGSIQSDSQHLLGRRSVDHGHDPTSMHKSSMSMSGLRTAFTSSTHDSNYPRETRAESGFSGTYSSDSSQQDALALRLQSFQFNNHSAPNGTGARQSPHYSNTHTPPVYDHLHPSRSEQSLSNGNNMTLVENKLRGLQQYSHDRRNYMNPHQYQAHQLAHQLPLVASHLQNPYNAYQYSNMPVNALGQILPQQVVIRMGSIGEAPHGARAQEENVSFRSSLLNSFKVNQKTSKKYELKEIYNHVVEFSGDQHGSRFIQQKLETANSDEKDILFQELKSNACQLMKDIYGNYVIQKFFEHGDQTQKRFFADRMKGMVVQLSINMYGCRVVQKALEHALTDQQAELVKELEGDVLKCVQDQNGNHVIQKAIECVPSENMKVIIQAFRGHVGTLASHTYGCRVIQRLLERCQEPERTWILQELHAVGPSLITHPYGNYVAQHVISHGNPEDRAKFLELVKAQLLIFSRHKYASNVVEKCLTHGTEQQRREIMLKVVESTDTEESTMMVLIKDPYGNYVLQKLMDLLGRQDYDQFVCLLRPELLKTKLSGTAGKQVMAMEKKIQACADRHDSLSEQALHRTSISSATDSAAEPTPPLTNAANSPRSASGATSAVDGPVYDISATNKGFSTAVDITAPTPPLE
ncbi:ARM repeat-containing protein [Delitschia confertaspora ATCC 74209]|uniref:Pumilio homology domain family member 3 n=1 Tax=Delitschia confertaspora ATCC 74209 TaxID=1513339 RepID=A0A9P4MW55_9PLEO|nr:ARM repeat-containing protein [Delitschia confertaspora ATCC 74209]